MSAKKPAKTPVGATSLTQRLEDPAVSRVISELTASVNALPQTNRYHAVVDLAVGANRVAHGLGRIPAGAIVTPTVADATWAWALTSKDARTVVITTIGVAQDAATVELF